MSFILDSGFHYCSRMASVTNPMLQNIRDPVCSIYTTRTHDSYRKLSGRVFTLSLSFFLFRSRKAQVLIYFCCSSLPKWSLGLLTIFGEGGEEGDLRKCFFLPSLGLNVFFFFFLGPSTNKNNKTKSVSQFSVTIFCSLVTSFGSSTYIYIYLYIYRGLFSVRNQ